ncbi:MAG: tetratricopeptide repeat protein [Phycisphaerales bacterium]|nr:tetratricopeptide repeat protein [Phycisphaerales bacterium]
MAKRATRRIRSEPQRENQAQTQALPAQTWLVVVILAAGALVYCNSLAGAFIFDDRISILDNEKITHLRPVGDLLKSRRPVVVLSLALNYAAGGLSPRGYHLFNLGVHLLAGLFLFGVIRRTMSSERMVEAFGRMAPWFAASVALLWVIHPLQTQSVTYVIQRSESLMGLFYLLTLYCLIRAATASSHSWPWYAASIASCGLGMGSKAVMVTAPVMMLFYDRVFLSTSWSALIRGRWAFHLGLAATWFVLFLYGIPGGVLNPSSKGVTVGFGVEGVSGFDYAMTQAGVILHYLRVALWPTGLCLDHAWPIVDGIGDAVFPGLVILALLIGVLWSYRAMPWLGFAGTWFFVILSPTSSFVPVKDAAFEHRMYLPLAAVLVVCLALFVRVFRLGFRRMNWSLQAGHLVLFVLMLVVVSVLGAQTYRRNALYHDPVLIWEDTVEKAPHNARAHNSLGWSLLEQGRTDEAIRRFHDASAQDSTYAAAHANLGTALMQKGDYPGAIKAFRTAFEIDPREFGAEFHLKLATAYFMAGEHASAVGTYQGVLETEPEACDESDYLHYGNALSTLGRLDEAVTAFRKSVAMNPTYAKGYYSLGNVLSWMNDLNGAMNAYREAIKIRPGFFEANVRLGALLDHDDRLVEAVACYRRALRRDSPQINPIVRFEAHYGLGQSLLRLDRFEEATVSFRTALEINPKDARAQRGLQTALSKGR